MSDGLTLRPGTPADVPTCAAICFHAFGGINARHGFPSDFPTIERATGLIGHCLSSSEMYSVVAESDGKVVGSCFLWEDGSIAGVGPITVDPAAQGGVGRRLMEDVLAFAAKRNVAGVRLVQAAFNTISMSLYTKLGFNIREPLVCLQGPPIRAAIEGYTVRPAGESDIETCCQLCCDVHGHERRGELAGAVTRGSARVVEHGGRIAGYVTYLGFMGHAVARENVGLMAILGAANEIAGPGLLLPSRNGELFRWCLENGLRIVQPMTLMSMGLYNEPRGAFLPSILF